MNDISEAREKCEEALVGIVLVDPASMIELESTIGHHHFMDRDLGDIFRAVSEMADARKAVDINAVLVELSQRGLITRIGGPAAIARIIDKGYSPGMVRYYAEQLRKIYRKDTVRVAAARLADSLGNPTADVSEAMARFEIVTQAQCTEPHSVVTVADASREALRLQREAKATGKTPGMPTGFSQLDQATGGLFRGQLVLISARSYLGKTTFGLNIGMNLGQQGYKVSFHCLEMKSFELAERSIASMGGPEYSQFTNCDMTDVDLQAAEKAIADMPETVWLNDSTSETVSTIAGKAKYHRAKHGLDILFVDHLQRLRKIDSKQETRHHLKDSCAALKNLARELDCCVVLLSQLRIDGDEDAEPNDASYSESKQIYEEADTTMMLHRKKNDCDAKLILNKVRKSQATEIKLHFDGSRQLFTDGPLGTAWTGATSSGFFKNEDLPHDT